MLTEQEQNEIRTVIQHEHNARAACPDALKIVQRHRGWVSDKALADVAAELGMTTTEVDAVATAYNLIFRRAVGRHVILMCDSVVCYVMHYEKLRQYLQVQFGIKPGQTTSDGRFTLLPIACLGACDLAPAAMVDGKLYGNLTPDSLGTILEQYP